MNNLPYKSGLEKKFRESLGAVLPIVLIVVLLSLAFAPMPSGILLSFLFGGLLLIVGMTFFSLGAELAMETMGGRLGAYITGSKKLWLVLSCGFLLGFMITVSEPDLQVLANQVPSIPNMVLILSVAAGVGIFMVISVLRMLFGIPLRTMLIACYALVFILVCFVPQDFLAVAFDSGGVTTGPMTVPFIMSFGVGIAAIRSDRHASDDSFGLVALCSIGPIITVLILGLIFRPESAAASEEILSDVADSVELRRNFLSAFPVYLKEIAISLLPIVAFFLLFQFTVLKLSKRTMIRISIGVLYTYIGLTLFLTGVNAGFLPAGVYLGETIASLPVSWVLVPLGMLIGYFIVKAEPAIYVLMRQVEELTNGAIKGKTLQMSLSVGVALSVGISMLRVLFGISLLWFVVPGYVIALAMTFFTPKIFSAVAFDSGGVASGPMTATFLLPLAMGACKAAGGNIVTDAFGVVALVAMIPLLTVQGLGLLYRFKEHRNAGTAPVPDLLSEYDDHAIIEL